MEPSRGNITPHRLFSVKELGVGNPEPNVDLVIKEFLAIGDAVAARWIQDATGNLVAPNGPRKSRIGAIYVYDRLRQEFYLPSFEGAEDDLTLDEFSQLLPEYNLLRYAEQPALLQVPFQTSRIA